MQNDKINLNKNGKNDSRFDILAAGKLCETKINVNEAAFISLCVLGIIAVTFLMRTVLPGTLRKTAVKINKAKTEKYNFHK